MVNNVPRQSIREDADSMTTNARIDNRYAIQSIHKAVDFSVFTHQDSVNAYQ